MNLEATLKANEHTEMTELAILEIKPENALVIFTQPDEKLDPILTAIEKEARALVADVSTKKGRDAIRSNAAKVARAKAAIERTGKELADQQKKIPKLIDASRKRSREFLESLQVEIRAPLTDWEEAEKRRVAELESRLNAITQLAVFDFEPTAAQLAAVLEKAKLIELGESWQEYADRASAEKHRVIAGLTELHAKTEKAEAEAAELERLRKEAAEREAKEAAERAEREKIEQRLTGLLSIPANSGDLSIQGLKAKIENVKAQPVTADEWRHKYADAVEGKNGVISALEKMLVDAEAAEKLRIEQAREKAKAELEAERQKAEQEKAAAIAKAKAEAEEKEAARVAEIERAKEAERKRAADKQHRTAINNAAAKRLTASVDISEAQAKAVITAIAKREIPHVFIQY